MTEKHYVIVPEAAVQPYLIRGYARSARSAMEHLGNVWDGSLGGENLVVLEIDPEQHRLLTDTHPKKYRMYMGNMVTAFDAISVVSVRVLEMLPDEGALVAREDRDTPPESCGTHDLFDTARACIDDKRDFLLEMIVRLRNSADALETFLRRTEAL